MHGFGGTLGPYLFICQAFMHTCQSGYMQGSTAVCSTPVRRSEALRVLLHCTATCCAELVQCRQQQCCDRTGRRCLLQITCRHMQMILPLDPNLHTKRLQRRLVCVDAPCWPLVPHWSALRCFSWLPRCCRLLHANPCWPFNKISTMFSWGL